MKIKPRLVRLSTILLMSVATTLIGVAFFLPHLLDVNAYRDEIIDLLQKSLNRPVSFTSGSYTWQRGPSFVFKNFSVKERGGSSNFLSTEQITVHLSLMPLLEKKVELKYLHLYGVNLSLIRYADGTLNIDDLLKPGKENIKIQLKRIVVKNGTVHWSDMLHKGGGLSTTLNNLSLSLDNIARGQKGTFKLSSDIPALSGSPTHADISGSVKLPAAGKPLLDTELNCDADIKQAEIGNFWPYYGRFIPFANTGGRVDFSSSFKGRAQDFAARGKIRIYGATVIWPTIFHAVLSPRLLQIDYSLKMNKQLIDFSSLDVGFDGFRIKGSLQIHDYATKDPRIVAKASTPGTFRYEDVKYFVPYGIIDSGASDYIEHKIKTGVFKLDAGILDGRISQITHMEIGDNCNTLYIRGPVEKAVLSYGHKAPTFNNIKGKIELKGKNFNLIGMTGNFGISPFKLDGAITEYNTGSNGKPSEYPVKMEITPLAPEVAWLAKIAGVDRLDYGNSSALTLTGSGPYSAFHLHGEWDLKQALYSFPDAIRKPVGMPNHISFNSIITADESRLTSLAYSLHPLTLSATALLKYGKQNYLGFDLQTNSFLLSETLPILPMWQQYRPNGKVQAHIKWSGNPLYFSAMDYSGDILLNGFSFHPGENTKPVSGINGTVAFKGDNLKTSGISVFYGSSPVTIKGKINSLGKNPQAEITLSSPEFFLQDISSGPSRSDAIIKKLAASLSIAEGVYRFKNVSGLLNSSDFNISGSYQAGTANEADIKITSTRFDFDDLKLIKSFASQNGGRSGSGITSRVKLDVDEGVYGRMHFSRFSANMQQENGILYLLGCSAGLFDGIVTAKGRLGSAGAQQVDRYDLTFDLIGADAEKLFRALDISREVTGTMSLRGNLTASGETLLEMKKNALGNMKLQMKSGKLRKFNSLSKVFSILNVSQLLKFRLPDMVVGGMPYNSVTGSISVKDGTISSKDLFISSDAINISLIGSADIVKEELNFTLGVQPLQTVDKIVSRIPVVGWLLTGKEKDFLIAYFEAKGKWSDPQVTAIPVKSMSKGILNIFIRVFELPVRLFTDTGEVILGQ